MDTDRADASSVPHVGPETVFEGQPPRPSSISRGAQTAWIVTAILVSVAGLLFYMEMQKPAVVWEDCWTDACRDELVARAVNNIERGIYTAENARILEARRDELLAERERLTRQSAD